MIHQLKLRVKSAAGSIQRVVVTASKRGYEPVGIFAERRGTHFDMQLKVESEKTRAFLVRVLEQLFDVESVE
jgi:acetolactate synthase regulatory subunit